MKRLLLFSVIALLAFVQADTSRGQTASSQAQTKSTGGAVDADAIIRAFTTKETEFRRALNNYSFQRDAVIQTIGMGGQVTGEFHRTSRYSFSDAGERYEKITFAPPPTLTEVSLTQEDFDDLIGVEPFALEASRINLYNFTYAGKEHIDELDVYAFDVAPKVMPKKLSDRMFMGRVWVDTTDLQVVKVRGKSVPEDKNNKYPVFETYREQIDGKYWFPTYTAADDVLTFSSGQSVHLKMLVRYTDFKRFAGKSKIVDEGEPGAVPAGTPPPVNR
ncbi:MAG: hypothetical protein ACJ741_04665 [Pyrinomonadaceae bacterium]